MVPEPVTRMFFSVFFCFSDSEEPDSDVTGEPQTRQQIIRMI
jgi:hypothetical protein